MFEVQWRLATDTEETDWLLMGRYQTEERAKQRMAVVTKFGSPHFVYRVVEVKPFAEKMKVWINEA